MTRRSFLEGVGVSAAGLALSGPGAVARAAAGPSAVDAKPLPPGLLQTSGAQIVSASGARVRLAGVNWYGFECNSMVAGGLDKQPLDTICRLIMSLGFNTVRLPFSVQMVQQNPRITSYLDANPKLRGLTALQIMDLVINTAGKHGLKVILDNHRSSAGWSAESNGLWYTRVYPEASWLAAWQQVVARYKHTSTVIGCDLRNEPGEPAHSANAWPRNGGALWGYNDPGNQTGQPNDWTAAATKAGNAVLAINPNLLIFVEGVRYDPAGPASNHDLYWPGGNLRGVGNTPSFPFRRVPVRIKLAVPNRLVYSVHDYGPDMYSGIPWCQRGSTAREHTACYDVWDQTWGYIFKEGIAPVWVFEFGTANGYMPGDTTPQQYYTDVNNVNPQGSWFTYLAQYIEANKLSWCYWCLNGTQSWCPGARRDPSKADWYGVLDPTWSRSASRPLMTKLKSIQQTVLSS